MAGTKAGAAKARDTNLKNNPDYYRKIGAKGGANGTTGGFYANRELARMAGRKGGRMSKRGLREEQYTVSRQGVPQAV